MKVVPESVKYQTWSSVKMGGLALHAAKSALSKEKR